MNETIVKKRSSHRSKAWAESGHGARIESSWRSPSTLVSAKQAGGLLSSIQRKLTVNELSDLHEQDVDRVAD